MSVTIKLPDGSEKSYSQPVSAAAVANDISPRLAKAAVAAQIDGQIKDLDTTMAEGCHSLRILTDRDAESMEVMRHTAAHIMAQAAVRLYGKDVKYTIGPALTNDFQYGFYYDVELPMGVGPDELARIEKEMARIVSEKLPVTRQELSVEAARELFTQAGQNYKIEMIDDLVAAQDVQSISIYRQGEFVDMCRGPHLPHTGMLKAFKLMTAAGAYWRGDEKNKMLTRIYGVAFFSDKELAEHLNRIEEARKRDHRVLGKQLGLFLVSDKVGPGLPLWLPNGGIVRMELENWLRGELMRRGYSIVYTPHIGKLDLYRTSGHYPYYSDSQFPPVQLSEEEGYLLKPMNCPHHMQIYKASQHSYRDLPVRLAEFGQVYRMEQTGELSGLTRVRGFTQDDAHIICTPEQLESELESCVEVTKLVLGTLGLDDYRVRVGLRDPDSNKYVGDAVNWDKAEANIRTVVRKLGMNYTEEKGEAAFYGPKIDFVVKDCIGREWQLGTIQVDYNLPQRFELEYTGADNAPHRPVMIHRAPFGSLERFIGILIEHFAGAFPLWLSPVQLAVLPVSDKFNDYAAGIVSVMRKAGIRVNLDDSSDKIGAKIRNATLAKVPYMAVVGQREQENQTVSLRHRTEGDKGGLSAQALADALRNEVDTKGKEPVRIAE